MDNKDNKDKKIASKTSQIKEELLITDPAAVPILFHEQKGMILKLLIEREMTIIDLKNSTGLNPGTVKRHINDLLKYGLVFIDRVQINEYSIAMKFYRAKAKKFVFKIEWPINKN
ncbi:MAG: ArsR family transcriptional regulator [Candidatus Heimdallarchaeaceae archaeon]